MADDEILGPESFRGNDEESHYNTSAHKALRLMRESEKEFVVLQHTCIKDDGGTPARVCYACEQERRTAVNDCHVQIADHLRRLDSEVATGGLSAILVRQREWSSRTFGAGQRTQGISNHIRKELEEIAGDPRDVREWIDVVILALDGYWRAGGSPERVLLDIDAKVKKNMARVWPADSATRPEDEAVEHDRSVST